MNTDTEQMNEWNLFYAAAWSLEDCKAGKEGWGLHAMRDDFRKAFFTEKELLGRHWRQRRNPVGRSVMGEVAEILGCKHDRFAWTGGRGWRQEWSEGRVQTDGRSYVQAVVTLCSWWAEKELVGSGRGVRCLLSVAAVIGMLWGGSRHWQGRGHQQKWGGVGRGHRDGIVTGQRGTVEVRKTVVGVRSLPGQGSWWTRSDGNWGWIELQWQDQQNGQG